MRTLQRIAVTFILLFPGLVLADTCDTLLKISYPDVTIYEVHKETDPVPYCKAKGRIGTTINFTLWLPEKWNGRFVMGGAGGFVGQEDNHAIRLGGESVLARGFATASTDTGHQGGAQDNSWGLNDYEAIVNYAYLAVHRAVVTSKAVIADHYGKAAEKSFFLGCSNGGRQAMHEAQRYPNDFDAIIAGAPALNFSGVTAAFVGITEKMYPDPSDLTAALVTPKDRALLRRAILDKCDKLDGLKDGILHDPNGCNFDVTTIQCAIGQEEACLSSDKIEAIQSVYQGPSNNHGQIFFGFPFGAEDVDVNGWGSWLTGGSKTASPNAAFNFGVGIMRNFVHHNPAWTYVDYDWNKFTAEINPVAHMIDANKPDLSEFRKQGGKLLMYHGWADVALTANMSIDYVNRVYNFDQSAREDVRLFMMPGVLHCYGGTGPSVVDWLDVLETWSDSGQAPTELAASYPAKDGSRKICAWPSRAIYQGGDPESVSAYACN